MKARVSVVIPVLNASDTIGQCIQSVIDQSDDIEIIVVDNGSSDNSAGIVKQFGPRVRLLHESHQSPGAARNRAIRSAHGEFIVFIDSDCIAAPGWIDAMVCGFRNPNIMMVGGIIKPYEERNLVQKYCGKFCHTQEYYYKASSPFVATANAAARKSEIMRADGFDPRFKTCDDLELCTRLIRSAKELHLASDALVYHFYSPKISVLMRKGFKNGWWIGMLTNAHRKSFHVKRLGYTTILRSCGPGFLAVKILHDLTFRSGYLLSRLKGLQDLYRTHLQPSTGSGSLRPRAGRIARISR